MKSFDLKAMDDACRLQEAARLRIADLETKRRDLIVHDRPGPPHDAGADAAGHRRDVPAIGGEAAEAARRLKALIEPGRRRGRTWRGGSRRRCSGT